MKNFTKKIPVIVIIFLFFCRTPAFAQDGAMQQGSSVITVGYGFPNLIKTVFSIYTSNYGYSTSGFGPIHFKYEYAINDRWGIGLSVGYVSYKVEWNPDELTQYEAGYKGSSFGVLARANYHFHFINSDKWDPFFGFGLGYNNLSFSYFDNNPNDYGGGTLTFPIPFALEVTIGCRYYIIPQFGVYAELGYAKDIFQFGAEFKFGGSK